MQSCIVPRYRTHRFESHGWLSISDPYVHLPGRDVPHAPRAAGPAPTARRLRPRDGEEFVAGGGLHAARPSDHQRTWRCAAVPRTTAISDTKLFVISSKVWGAPALNSGRRRSRVPRRLRLECDPVDGGHRRIGHRGHCAGRYSDGPAARRTNSGPVLQFELGRTELRRRVEHRCPN
eukprot:SAG31_NODE_1185_length_9494_cov_5.602980_1_plen_177_part_00